MCVRASSVAPQPEVLPRVDYELTEEVQRLQRVFDAILAGRVASRVYEQVQTCQRSD